MMLSNKLANQIEALTKQRTHISEILNNSKLHIKKKSTLNFSESLVFNPFLVLLELLAFTILGITALSPLYNFIFVVPLQSITLALFSIFISFVIVMPFNLTLNYIVGRHKRNFLINSGLIENLKILQKLEKQFLEYMLNTEVNFIDKLDKIDIFKESEVDTDFLMNSIYFSEYQLKKGGYGVSFSGGRYFESVFGKYIFIRSNYQEDLTHGSLDVCGKKIVRKIYGAYKIDKFRFLPSNRSLFKRLIFFAEKTSKVSRVKVEVNENGIKIVIFDPNPLGEDYVELDLPDLIISVLSFFSGY